LCVNASVGDLQHKNREEHLDKVCALARLVAVLLAIISPFVAIPQLAAILLVLGGIAAITNTAEDNMRSYVVTLVLILGAKTLEALPTVGAPLAVIFGNLGVALVGVSIVAISIRVVTRIKGDWIK
jgi:hypothetical protein